MARSTHTGVTRHQRQPDVEEVALSLTYGGRSTNQPGDRQSATTAPRGDKTPLNNGVAQLGGISVGFGAYLSLGHAPIRTDSLPGHPLNEGPGGATTFARRVVLPPRLDSYDAKYVVISTANDCLHADAFGIPQSIGLAWFITEADYQTLREAGRTRIRAELPAAIQLDIWKDFKHAGDGIHPDDATTKRAAKVIAQELKRRD
jgi:hypothetical protein